MVFSESAYPFSQLSQNAASRCMRRKTALDCFLGDRSLTNQGACVRIDEHPRSNGPVAQLGARFHGMEEVVGSIPTRSTNLSISGRYVAIYILQSKSSGKFYIGCAEDPSVRLAEHQRGQTISTRGRGPWLLVYREDFETLPEARRRERQLKSWKSHRSIWELID
jgi:putative endonuclease